MAVGAGLLWLKGKETNREPGMNLHYVQSVSAVCDKWEDAGQK